MYTNWHGFVMLVFQNNNAFMKLSLSTWEPIFGFSLYLWGINTQRVDPGKHGQGVQTTTASSVSVTLPELMEACC